MLFNTYEFVLLFLPVALVGYHWLGRSGQRELAFLWLAALSLLLYGWWEPRHVVLLLGSVAFNYGVGIALSRRPSRLVLALGVIANLACLGYYKYTDGLSISAVLPPSCNTITGRYDESMSYVGGYSRRSASVPDHALGGPPAAPTSPRRARVPRALARQKRTVGRVALLADVETPGKACGSDAREPLTVWQYLITGWPLVPRTELRRQEQALQHGVCDNRHRLPL